MHLETPSFLLRPWQRGDEKSLIENANNKKIWNNLRDYFPHPYTQQDAESWISLQENAESLNNFAIEKEGLAVGGIGLVPGTDVYRKNAEIGYWLGEDYWGQGIVSEAVGLLVTYGFEELGFEKIYAGVFAPNIGSMRVLEKAGFVKEAILKKGVYKNGTFLDEHYYAIWKQ